MDADLAGITEALTRAQFRFDANSGSWVNLSANVRVWDTASANFILTAQGLRPIDIHAAPIDESKPMLSVVAQGNGDLGMAAPLSEENAGKPKEF